MVTSKHHTPGFTALHGLRCKRSHSNWPCPMLAQAGLRNPARHAVACVSANGNDRLRITALCCALCPTNELSRRPITLSMLLVGCHLTGLQQVQPHTSSRPGSRQQSQHSNTCTSPCACAAHSLNSCRWRRCMAPACLCCWPNRPQCPRCCIVAGACWSSHQGWRRPCRKCNAASSRAWAS